MNDIDNLLSQLEKLRAYGPGRWMACCPAHEDRSPSLSIRECDDGSILLHCFASCSTREILESIGLNFSDLFPNSKGSNYRHSLPVKKRKFLFETLRHEREIFAIFIGMTNAGNPPSNDDSTRTLLAQQRIRKIAGVLSHG